MKIFVDWLSIKCECYSSRTAGTCFCRTRTEYLMKHLLNVQDETYVSKPLELSGKVSSKDLDSSIVCFKCSTFLP